MLLIALGHFVGRRRWVGPTAVKDLSNLVFLVLSPALLFRTMSQARLDDLSPRPLLAYFGAAILLFAAMLVARGFSRRTAVLALAATFSNTVMIGVPLITLAFGQEGLAQLLPLISVHALILLTLATVVLELAMQREQGGGESRRIGQAVALAVRSAVLHPVPLPILAGVLFGLTGLALPAPIDLTMQLLGQAFAPIALLMVGITLGHGPVGPLWKPALGLALIKNFAHPALVFALGWLLGLQGLAFQVTVLAACLPMGANVYLFSQRYQVAESLVTAAVAVSTLLTVVSLTLALALLGIA